MTHLSRLTWIVCLSVGLLPSWATVIQPSEDLSPLVARAAKLRGSGTTADRKQLILQIERQWLTDAVTIQAVKPEAWFVFSSSLVQSMSREQRTEWAAKLLDAFAVRDLSFAEFKSILRSIEDLVSPQARRFVAAWIVNHDSWENWTLPELLLAVEYAPPPAQRDETALPVYSKIIAHVGQKYMATPDAVQGVTPKHWAMIAGLAVPLPDAVRAPWRTCLHQAFGGAGLSAADFTHLGRALEALGDKNLNEFKGAWFMGQDVWKAWKAFELAEALFGMRLDKSPLVRQLRSQMVPYVQQTYMQDVRSVAAISPGDWNKFADALSDGFTDDQRTYWLDRWREAFVPRKLSMIEFNAIVSGMNFLRKGAANRFMAEWARGHAAWQDWSVWELANILQSLHGDPSIAANEFQRMIIGFLEQRYLPDPAAVQLGTPHDWMTITQAVVDDLAPPQRYRWSQALRRGFGEADIDSTHVKFMQVTLRQLGDVNAAGFTSPWMGAHEQWQAWQAAQWADLNAALKSLSRPEREQWARLVYAAMLGTAAGRAQVTPPSLVGLAMVFRWADLSGADKNYPELADTVADLAQSNRIDQLSLNEQFALAHMLRNPQSRKRLETVLVDAQGVPRLAVGSLLSWVHAGNNSGAAWLKDIDARLAGASVSGDQQACWLLIKAYAASALVVRGDPLRDFNRSRPCLEQAQSKAVSETARMQVVLSRVDLYRQLGDHETAVACLKENAGQFGEANLKQVRAMERQIGATLNRRLPRIAPSKASKEPGAFQGLQEYLQAQMEGARASGATERVVQLEQVLALFQLQPKSK